MRVTKIIRDYVEKRVNEIYGELTEEEKLYEEEKAKFENEVKLANERIRKIIEEESEKIPNPYGLRLDITTSTIYSTWRYGGELPEIQAKARIKENERADKKNKAIENILITLELGGTKAQLEEMLKELK